MKSKYIIFLIIAVVIVSGYLFFSQSPSDNGSSSMKESTGAYNIQTEDVNYFEDVNGFLAEPSADESFPGVVMIHEWWGLNENIENMATRLAGQGYRVLAVDLYNGEVADNSERARELSSSLDQEKALENLQSATDYLRQSGSERIASLGWCFGGGQSMQLSLNEELDATVIYYGSLVTDQEEVSNINWPVLGIFGQEDQVVSTSSVDQFEEALNNNNIVNEIYMYPGVGHAFANPSGDNYSSEEAQDAWDKTINFLQENLK